MTKAAFPVSFGAESFRPVSWSGIPVLQPSASRANSERLGCEESRLLAFQHGVFVHVCLFPYNTSIPFGFEKRLGTDLENFTRLQKGLRAQRDPRDQRA